MSEKYLVVGAGPVGTELSQLLAGRGAEVTVVTRSGGRSSGSVTRMAADASDADRLSELAVGARALFNCANPSDYTQWAAAWPPLADSLLVTAERSGAPLVMTGNLYPYGPVDEPMVEGQPDRATDEKGRLRAGMWAEALRRHEAGRIRAVEVRGSDYVGPGVGENGHLSRHVARARRGKGAWVVGRPDLPHTWTDVGDMARALAAVAGREDTWGQVWHAPSNEPRTQQQGLTDVLAADGLPPVPVRGIPDPVLAGLGFFAPLIRQLREMSYMFQRPYVMSSTHTQEVLGLTPTPWAQVCHRTVTGN